jgi:hypothetical protein
MPRETGWRRQRKGKINEMKEERKIKDESKRI